MSSSNEGARRSRKPETLMNSYYASSVEDSCYRTIIDYAERTDRDAKRKMNSMNLKLMDIGRQMEAVEAEISRAAYTS
ncbi:hypothetical protein MKW94_018653 [Papaver nudicaule]|uniref:Uncharacterized protein n=1 Tax=Papaver nudicaule TaxID=74823 RepID=A0AA41VXF3_PAPNU|nr:hypothetical protein [Papaver nudicaule]MCL7049252.1 hypothetical protein [Papaver nudicaule]